MARPAPQPDKLMVLLEMQYQKFLLPIEDGVLLFTMLSKGTQVEYDYDSKSWRYTKSNHGLMPTLRMFSLTEMASLALSDPAE